MAPSPRRTLVTGASQPAALAIVRQCLVRGDRVIAAARQPARVSALADLRAEFGGLDMVGLDPADAASVADALPIIEGLTDSIDFLVIGASEPGPHDRAAELERDEHFDRLSGTGLIERVRRRAVAPLLLVRTLLPLLVASDSARVLVVGDAIAVGAGTPEENVGYASLLGATALHAGARLLARDLVEHRIPVCIGNLGHASEADDEPAFSLPLDEAAAGLIGIADRMRLDRSGRFFDWTGAERS